MSNNPLYRPDQPRDATVGTAWSYNVLAPEERNGATAEYVIPTEYGELLSVSKARGETAQHSDPALSSHLDFFFNASPLGALCTDVAPQPTDLHYTDVAPSPSQQATNSMASSAAVYADVAPTPPPAKSSGYIEVEALTELAPQEPLLGFYDLAASGAPPGENTYHLASAGVFYELAAS